MYNITVLRLVLSHFTFKALNLKVDVYYHFRKKCLVIRCNGVIIGYAYNVTLKTVKFVINPAGLKRVRKKKRKNVHAFARGILISVDDEDFQPSEDLSFATYNPYEVDTFVTNRGTSEQAPVHWTNGGTVTTGGVWFKPQPVDESSPIANKRNVKSFQTATPGYVSDSRTVTKTTTKVWCKQTATAVYVSDSHTVTKSTTGVWCKLQPLNKSSPIANDIHLEDTLQDVVLISASLPPCLPAEPSVDSSSNQQITFSVLSYVYTTALALTGVMFGFNLPAISVKSFGEQSVPRLGKVNLELGDENRKNRLKIENWLKITHHASPTAHQRSTIFPSPHEISVTSC